LVVINFVVVTKGAERIAEVGARFALDAMPGKQMAIDADLSAGLIDEKDATYFVASRKFVNPPKESLNRIEGFIFAAMHRNSTLASDYFRLPANRVINFSVSMEK
jgi:K+ transporter